MAQRRYARNLGKRVAFAEFQRLGFLIFADPIKIDNELDGIVRSPGIVLADPSVSGQFGNLAAVCIPVTTPATAGVEFAVKHNLGIIPVGIKNVAQASTSPNPLVTIGNVRWRASRTADITNVYLQCPDTADQSITTAFVIWART